VLYPVNGKRTKWVVEVDSGVATPLTHSGLLENHPRWSPTGREIVSAAQGPKSWNAYVRATDGSGESRPIAAEEAINEYPADWSPDGNFILLGTSVDNLDLWYLRRLPDGKFERVRLLVTDSTERHARFSPDGKYFAYCSNESGRDEVYVRGFPSADNKVRVSHNGGCTPLFTANGRELLFIEGDALMTAPVTLAPVFASGTPRFLFRNSDLISAFNIPATADGQRFLFAEPVLIGGEGPSPLDSSGGKLVRGIP